MTSNFIFFGDHLTNVGAYSQVPTVFGQEYLTATQGRSGIEASESQ